VSLVRYGTLTAGVGLTVALLWAVAFGPTLGCTEVACPGATPAYSVAGVSLLPPALSVSDGCNVCAVAPPVVYGGLAAVVGAVVGVVGQVRRASA
jgi:hypothetical protein